MPFYKPIQMPEGLEYWPPEAPYKMLMVVTRKQQPNVVCLQCGRRMLALMELPVRETRTNGIGTMRFLDCPDCSWYSTADIRIEYPCRERN